MTEVVFYRTSAVRPGTTGGPRQGAGRVHPPLPPWFRGGARWAGRQCTASPLVVGRDLVLEVALPRVGTVPPLRLPRLLAEATLVWVGGGGGSGAGPGAPAGDARRGGRDSRFNREDEFGVVTVVSATAF